MDEEKIKYYSTIATKSMNDGYRAVSESITDHGLDKARELFKMEIRLKYDWIDESNINDLFSTGTYYHFK